MFLPLLKKYVIVFILTFTGYSFLNWYVSTHLDLGVNIKYLDFWFPFAICFAISFFIFRPVVKKLNYPQKSSNGLLWVVIPFSIWVPIAFSQSYFRDISYKVISIEKPSDIYNNPHQRFFDIKTFAVDPNKYFILREQHTSGRFGTTLHVTNYYIAPMYDDTDKMNSNTKSKIGYGIKFTTTMSNSFLVRDKQGPKIEAFNEQSSKDYDEYDFTTVDYFEKITNTDDAENFAEALGYNNSFDHINDIILIKHTGSINDIYKRDKNMMIYSTIITFIVALLLLLIIHYCFGK